MPKDKKSLANAGFTLKMPRSASVESKGFTLIELLIVIVIISILAVFLFVAFTQVQKNARDAQRKSDLQTVANALQRFYSDNSVFPTASAGGNITYQDGNCTSTGTVQTPAWGTDGITCGSPSKTYIKQLPKDPIGTFQYCYINPGGNTQNYYLFAEHEGNGNVDPMAAENECNGIGYKYRVTAQD